MDRTSWKPKVFKATESVDYKVNEVNIERGGSSMKIDGKNVIKIWESFSGWYWYAIEDQGSYTGIGADGNEVQAHAWYGYVQGMENEWGTWDSNELERAGVWTVPKSNWGWTGKESKASESWTEKRQQWLDARNSALGGNYEPFYDLVMQGDHDWNDFLVKLPEILQQIDMELDKLGESKANEDDHKKSWDKLDSIAKMGFSDIGYDKKSWDSEPEEIRAEMEKVVKDNLGENWKEVANKFYNEELNKGKKSGGESKASEGIEQFNLKEIVGLYEVSTVMLPAAFNDLKMYETMIIKNGEFMNYKKTYRTEEEARVGHQETIMKVRQNEIGEARASEADQSEVSDYLDMLRESGVTNMFGAGSYIEEEFGVSRQEARKFLQNWMENFGKASETDPCWKGYKQIGMKDKNGKQVPNCVPNANEGHHDDGCWTCGTEIAFDKKYCQYHCYHEDFDDFTGKCRDCGQKLPLAMMVESEGDSDYCKVCGDFDESHYNEDGSVRDHEFKSGGTSNEGLIDNIEKELLRFGINLDKDPDQVAESKVKANEEGVNDWWDKVTTDGSDLDMQFRGTHFNELPLHQQNHYFNLYMEELGNDKYGNHMALYDTKPDSYSSSDLWKDDPSLGNNDQYYTGWKINEPTVNPSIDVFNDNIREQDDDMIRRMVFTTESKASEDYYNKTAEDYADMVEGEEPEPDEDLMKGVDVESKASEGFYQGLHGYVDAKCKTCGGLEFGSIEDMNDHFAMNSDHISNLDDLDNDIPNSD